MVRMAATGHSTIRAPWQLPPGANAKNATTKITIIADKTEVVKAITFSRLRGKVASNSPRSKTTRILQPIPTISKKLLTMANNS